MDHETLIETLASQLHREHRAAEKAMNRVKFIFRAGVKIPNPNRLLHDHGWSSCGQREYFRNRARLLISRSLNHDAQTLGEAEEALNAQVLRRRIAVGLATDESAGSRG